MAAIQLPATRIAIRAHGILRDTTNAAPRATIVKTAHPIPTSPVTPRFAWAMA